MTLWVRQNYRYKNKKTKQNYWLPGCGRQQKDMGISILAVVVVTYLYTFVHSQNFTIKRANFTVCKLYT